MSESKINGIELFAHCFICLPERLKTDRKFRKIYEKGRMIKC